MVESSFRVNSFQHFSHTISRYIKLFSKYIQVSKIQVSIGITLSTMAGYLIAFPSFDRVFWTTALSSLLLCSGGGALNNYRDRHIDRLLQRTSRRPLPSGSISERGVLLQGSLLIFSALIGFCFTRNALCTLFLALLGILLYNGIYTPLKSRTILSIIPGAVCGMVPPLMGWSGAGGDLGKAQADIFYLMTTVGVWQLPHFWLILMTHATDYEQICARRILPSMLGLFNRSQLRRITLIWILLYSSMLMMAPLFSPVLSHKTQWIVILNGVALFILFSRLHLLDSARDYRLEFMVLNGSMGLFILAMIFDRV